MPGEGSPIIVTQPPARNGILARSAAAMAQPTERPVQTRRDRISGLPMSSDPMISVRELTKQFRSYKRREGLWGGIQNLVRREHINITAVERVSFEIGRGEMVGYI